MRRFLILFCLMGIAALQLTAQSAGERMSFRLKAADLKTFCPCHRRADRLQIHLWRGCIVEPSHYARSEERSSGDGAEKSVCRPAGGVPNGWKAYHSKEENESVDE